MKFIVGVGGGGGGEAKHRTLDTGRGLGRVICICTHDAMHVYM